LRPFAYLRPTTLDQTIAALADPAAKPYLLAGGTDLIVRLRRGHLRPSVVIDTKRVRDLHDEIAAFDGGLRIGARVTMTSIIRDARVRQHFEALVEAASVVGSVQIRNRATLTGNICNASPAADTVPALLVYGAVANVVGTAGSRQVPLSEFFTAPGRTVLTRGEMLESVDLPFPEGPVGAAFGRVTRRRGVDLATINMCGLVDSSGTARFAFGAVAPTPFVSADHSGALAVGNTDENARAAALGRLFSPARPITDVRGSLEYRSAMLEVMTNRTWQTAAARLTKRMRRGTS
jgi:CO/xanthine dehydrogenase FAD-binding subunit